MFVCVNVQRVNHINQQQRHWNNVKGRPRTLIINDFEHPGSCSHGG